MKTKTNNLKPAQVVMAMMQNGATSDQIAREHPYYYMMNRDKINSFIDTIQNLQYSDLLDQNMSDVVLKPWQQDCYARLLTQDDRSVLWVHDHIGITSLLT